MDEEQDLFEVASESAVGAAFLVGGQLAAMAAATLGAIVLARLLGPEGYGLYSLSLVIPTFMALSTGFGVPAALTAFAARFTSEGERKQLAELVATAVWFEAGVSALVSVAGACLAPYLATVVLNRPELVATIKLATAYLPFFTIASTCSAALLGMGLAKGAALVSVVREFARALLSAVLVVLGWSYSGAVSGYVAGHAFSAAVGLFLLLRALRGLGRFKLEFLKSMLGYGLPLHASTVLAAGVAAYQSAVLAWFATNVEVGNFKAALGLAAPLQTVAMQFSTALFPAFSKLGERSAGRAFKHAVRYVALFMVPSAFFTAVASKDLIQVVYGSAYRLAPLYLSVYALFYAYTGFGAFTLGSFFRGIGRTDLNLKSSIVYASVFVLLAPLGAAKYGALGVLAALLVASAARVLFALWCALRVGALYDAASSIKVYGAAAIPVLAVFPIVSMERIPLLARLIASATVYWIGYLVSALLLECFKERDLKIIELALGRGFMRKPVRILAGVLRRGLRVRSRILSGSG